MNTTLWIIQGILSAVFLLAGLMKLTESKKMLADQLTWTNDFSLRDIRMIGLSELLCGIGILLPHHTGIAPILTPVAAVGICLIMLLAMATVHFKRKENRSIAGNIILFLMAAFVAYGRF